MFHVSTDPNVVEEMDFLIDMMRPIFSSYYDLMKFISRTKKGSHVSITNMVQNTSYSRDRVNRIVNWLLSKDVIEMSEEDKDCFHITCRSFDSVLIEVRKLVL